MSDKLTRINLPGLPNGEGFMEWGEQTPEHMIDIMRRRAMHMRVVANAIDAAADADFKIDVVRGSIVQHQVKSLQPGRSKP